MAACSAVVLTLSACEPGGITDSLGIATPTQPTLAPTSSTGPGAQPVAPTAPTQPPTQPTPSPTDGAAPSPTTTPAPDEETMPPAPAPEQPAPTSTCESGTCVEGVGLDVGEVKGGERLYKAEDGYVSFPSTLPERLDGLDYATFDRYPDNGERDSGDTRTDESVDRVRSVDSDTLLVAIADPEAANGGWSRVESGDGDGADLELNDDGERGYWFYEHAATADWVDMPEFTSDLPPFVFAESGTLTFANPLPLPNGVRIAGSGFIANPTLTIVPGEFDGDGNGVADGDTDGDGTVDNDVYLADASGVSRWKVWRSLDEGATWENWARPDMNINRQTIFFHNDVVYVMGRLKRTDDRDANAKGIIYASTDGGENWDDGTLLPFDAGDAPANVVVTDGRIWKAVPPLDGEGSSLASAPEDADLTDADSWTVADGTSVEGQNPDEEGITLLNRDGRVANVALAKDSKGYGGVSLVYADGPDKTTFDPETGYSPLSQNGKFSIVYDEPSDRYWALSNTDDAQPRHILGLYSSTDLESWTLEREVLKGPSSKYHGFNYPSIQIDGDAMVFVSRTAWESAEGQPPRWHDANMFTFHRIEDFRTTP